MRVCGNSRPDTLLQQDAREISNCANSQFSKVPLARIQTCLRRRD
jgi:hypothetical protein